MAIIDEVEREGTDSAWVSSFWEDSNVTKNSSLRDPFPDPDQLRQVLTTAGLALNLHADRSTPLHVRLAIRLAESLRTITVSGDPIGVSRGRGEVSFDDGAFLGVLFQKAGRTVRSFGQEQTIINPGDLVIWHGRRPLRFDMPETFQKICLLVSLETFERILPGAESYAGLHLSRQLNVCRLLGACLSTLADHVLTNDDEPPTTAIEVTLDVLGAALTRHQESTNMGPRTNLYQRITNFIEKRLGDPELCPAMLAQKHHISTRYLHLLFSERGSTVGNWIRVRRLAQCRHELAKWSNDRSITEICMRWGFNDAAHFSRSFKSMYGVSPLKFRMARRGSNR